MFLLSGQGDFSSDAEIRQIKADIDSVYDRLPANARLRPVIRGALGSTGSPEYRAKRDGSVSRKGAGLASRKAALGRPRLTTAASLWREKNCPTFEGVEGPEFPL